MPDPSESLLAGGDGDGDGDGCGDIRGTRACKAGMLILRTQEGRLVENEWLMPRALESDICCTEVEEEGADIARGRGTPSSSSSLMISSSSSAIAEEGMALIP